MDNGIKMSLSTPAQSSLIADNGARIINKESQKKELNIEKVAQDFESFLIFTMMKELEKTTHSSKKNYTEQTYMSIMYEKMGDFLSKKGLGVKDMLVKYMDNRNIKVIKEKGDNLVK